MYSNNVKVSALTTFPFTLNLGDFLLVPSFRVSYSRPTTYKASELKLGNLLTNVGGVGSSKVCF